MLSSCHCITECCLINFVSVCKVLVIINVVYSSFSSVNGTVRKIPLLNKAREDIQSEVELLKNQSGRDIIKMRKWWHTDNPSIQGMWHPFTNKSTDLNLVEFPMEKPTLVMKAGKVKLSEDVHRKLRAERERDQLTAGDSSQ